MKYDKTKTYFTKANSTKELMEKIEEVSSVLWGSKVNPTEFYPGNEVYCIYNYCRDNDLTYACILNDPCTFADKLTENEFVKMLSELKPKVIE